MSADQTRISHRQKSMPDCEQVEMTGFVAGHLENKEETSLKDRQDGERLSPSALGSYQNLTISSELGAARKYIAYTVKLPCEQLAALQSIWLELKRLYGAHSPDKSGMIQQAVAEWLKRWDGPEREELLKDLLEIREDTRKRQYRK